MSEEDQAYMSTIINLEISDLEVMRALSIYFDWRANGYPPEQSYSRGVQAYMETGEIPVSKDIG